MTLYEKVQQVQQMKSVDAAAVVTGVAVWAEWIPTIVGIFTIAWLGMQMVINFPKMYEVIKGLIKRLKGE